MRTGRLQLMGIGVLALAGLGVPVYFYRQAVRAEEAYHLAADGLRDALPISHHDLCRRAVGDLLRAKGRGFDYLHRLDREFEALVFDEAQQVVHFFRVHPPDTDGHTACLTTEEMFDPSRPFAGTEYRFRSSTFPVPKGFTPTRFESTGDELRLVLNATMDRGTAHDLKGIRAGADYVAIVSGGPARPVGPDAYHPLLKTSLRLKNP